MRRFIVLPAVLLTLLAAGAAPPDAPIADAAMRGDVAAVRSLIKSGAEVNAAQGDGMTALHWAADLGNEELARILVAAGANVNARTRIGHHAPLHVAAENGHGPIVRLLADAGADVRATSLGGVTPLHAAALSGDSTSVASLLSHGADANARELSWAQTPLMFAADHGRVAAVRLLLASGADVSATTRVVEFSQRARQDRRAEQVRDSVLAAFRVRAADPVNWRPDPAQVQASLRAAREHEVLSPAQIQRIDWDAAQIAGRAPSNADLVGYQGGLTALHHAVREGHHEAAMALLEGGADVNQLSEGTLATPLLTAVMNGHFDIALDLMARGADVRTGDFMRRTPLYAAISAQWAPRARYPQQQAYAQQKATYLEMMEALLKAGADPNVRLALHDWYLEYNFAQFDIDAWGATPFWRASHALDVEAMKLLVRYGADPHIPTRASPGDRHGDAHELIIARAAGRDLSGLPPVPNGGPGVYPIHVVSGYGGEGAGSAANSQRHVRDGWIPALRYLVEELGADVTLRDFLGYGTIHHAAGRGMNDVIHYLVSKGADPTVVGRLGLTTIDLANGPRDGVYPFPSTILLLDGLGAVNNHICQTC
jgi:ankyrin repeat protein